jgi:hypothetical protein
MARTLTNATNGFRTRPLTLERAASFARCVRANRQYEQVEIVASRSPGKYCVQFAPTAQRRQEYLYDLQQESRRQRALAEGGQYLWFRDPDWPGYAVCFSVSGEHYLVSMQTCQCPDWEYRCKANNIRCKHQIALHDALTEGRLL